ncbi:RNA-binding protein 12 [Diaphorina citri]|uniref:RNA-binding protein 12 n=1 Tax=Diaphorina citri TaxID=121845 RepID=A0A3Q0IHU1_DIACI|nr:RNA-binding protein 12 [Diaphorina citri]
MSVIIRLQNLPWSANSMDIRQYFQGLSIPEGGVHIVGGEQGDAFIAFSTDEDARQAMMNDGGKIKEVKIKLLLSSRSEMQKVIEQARQTSVSFQTMIQNPVAPVTNTPVAPAPNMMGQQAMGMMGQTNNTVQNPSQSQTGGPNTTAPAQNQANLTQQALAQKDWQGMAPMGMPQQPGALNMPGMMPGMPLGMMGLMPGLPAQFAQMAQMGLLGPNPMAMANFFGAQKNPMLPGAQPTPTPGATDSQPQPNLQQTPNVHPVFSQTPNNQFMPTPGQSMPQQIPGPNPMMPGPNGPNAMMPGPNGPNPMMSGPNGPMGGPNGPNPMMSGPNGPLGGPSGPNPMMTGPNGPMGVPNGPNPMMGGPNGPNPMMGGPNGPNPMMGGPNGPMGGPNGPMGGPNLMPGGNNDIQQAPAPPSITPADRSKRDSRKVSDEDDVKILEDSSKSGRSRSRSRERRRNERDRKDRDKKKRSRSRSRERRRRERSRSRDRRDKDRKSRKSRSRSRDRSRHTKDDKGRDNRRNERDRKDRDKKKRSRSRSRERRRRERSRSRDRRDKERKSRKSRSRSRDRSRHTKDDKGRDNANKPKEEDNQQMSFNRSFPGQTQPNRPPVHVPFSNIDTKLNLNDSWNNKGSDYSLNNKMPEANTCVEVRNVPLNVRYTDIKAFFQYHQLYHDGIKIINDNNGKRTGILYVQFLKSETRNKALKELNGARMIDSQVELLPIDDEIFKKAVDSYRPPRNAGPMEVTKPPPIVIFKVMGLPANVQRKDIAQIFDGFELETIRVNREDSNKVLAYVRIKSESDALNFTSIRKTHTVAGKPVLVVPCFEAEFSEAMKKFPDEPDPIKTDCVLIKNLPRQATDGDVCDFFSDIGLVPLKIHLMFTAQGEPSGDVFCEFQTPDEANRAISKNETLFGRNTVSVLLVTRQTLNEALGSPLPAPGGPSLLGPGPPFPRPNFMGPGPGPNFNDPRMDRQDPRMGDPRQMDSGPMGPNGMGGPNDMGGPLMQRPGILGPRGPGGPPSRFDNRYSPRGGGGMGGRGRGRGGDGGGGDRYNDFNRGGPDFNDYNNRGGPNFNNRGGPDRYNKYESDVTSPENFGRPGCVLALENIPYRANMDDILAFFNDFELTRDNIIRRYDEEGRATGDARVCLVSPSEAQRALRQLNQVPIQGRPVYISPV